MTHKIIIDENGMLRCLRNDAVPMHELGKVTTTRLSHIVPLWEPARSLFKLLRLIFGDRGKVAAWTRTWRCWWKVTIISTGRWNIFRDRADAVKWEIERVNI